MEPVITITPSRLSGMRARSRAACTVVQCASMSVPVLLAACWISSGDAATVDFRAAWQSLGLPEETRFRSSQRLPCRAWLRKQKSADGRHIAPKGLSAGPMLLPDCAPHRARFRATPVLVRKTWNRPGPVRVADSTLDGFSGDSGKTLLPGSSAVAIARATLRN